MRKTLMIKKIARPTKKSGKPLQPGEVSEWKTFGVKIVNTGTDVVYVDSKTSKN